MKKERELVEMLKEEIKRKKDAGNLNVEADIFEQILSYLSEHNMLLRDSVYPHLCTVLFE